MKLTQGAVKALKMGAHSRHDVNAITCREHIAGQLDPSVRPFLQEDDEFKPVLEVKRTEGLRHPSVWERVMSEPRKESWTAFSRMFRWWNFLVERLWAQLMAHLLSFQVGWDRGHQ